MGEGGREGRREGRKEVTSLVQLSYNRLLLLYNNGILLMVSCGCYMGGLSAWQQ